MDTIDKESSGVMLDGETAHIKLSRWGRKRSDDEVMPAAIEVTSGPFSGTVKDDSLAGIDVFCDDLFDLYEHSTGSATLSSYEKFKMECEVDRRGSIKVSVELFSGDAPLSKLNFEMFVERSVVPVFIEGLRREFLDV